MQVSVLDDRESAPVAIGEHLRSDALRAALRIQQALLDGARTTLRSAGFVELLPPVIGPVTDPGGRGSKQADVDYYGNRYKLMSSAILYKQAMLTTFDKIFYVAPNVRLEPLETTSTKRHLCEFHQLDVEIAGAGHEEAMAVAEGVVTSAIEVVLRDCADELALLGRDVAALMPAACGGFERRTHDSVVSAARAAGHTQDAAAEIAWSVEEKISAAADRPFFVTGYPKGSRGFYDMEDPGNPGTLMNFDLLAGEGYGEICSGSRREHEYVNVVTRMRESGENPAKYKWYLDMVRSGIPASAGFGIGLERMTRWVGGLGAVWQATAFPKLAGVVAP
ncbi:asparagine synthetase A [Micromonospora sp. AKA38]|uniref:asparagine synthetase A n=1 Tax=Micromonospora sp. AKA38 TaxID=2733861 RepID=UPI0022C52091|nr:asparagine synthetase A [Micromonospora sp. AKA38]GHJ15501.1 hypothetical protein TPA0908_34960 [Micromonospora sp. AKA38]